MKEQEYKKHIKGCSLDKLQEGDFVYDKVKNQKTLSDFAKELREKMTSEGNEDGTKSARSS